MVPNMASNPLTTAITSADPTTIALAVAAFACLLLPLSAYWLLDQLRDAREHLALEESQHDTTIGRLSAERVGHKATRCLLAISRESVAAARRELEHYFEKEADRLHPLMALPAGDFEARHSPLTRTTVLTRRAKVPILAYSMTEDWLAECPFTHPGFRREYAKLVIERFANEYAKKLAPQLLEFLAGYEETFAHD
jgi:hypothetical protein